MGLIDRALGLLFGGGNNIVRETAEVFVENAEKGAARDAVLRGDALAQFAGEFGGSQRGLFDRLMDALNRIPRPAMALGTLGLFAAAMIDPIWFAQRMQGIALVPEPMWWLLGAVVSFYFGARHQLKNQQFQKQISATMALAPQVMQNLDTLRGMQQEQTGEADDPAVPERREPVLSSVRPMRAAPAQRSAARYDNAALQDWATQSGANQIDAPPRGAA